MYTVYGERYFNDFTRKLFEMRFRTLDDIFEYMKKISYNFTKDSFFPTNINNREGFEWVSRISCYGYDDNRYPDLWIYKIEDEEGIVFSNGRYTAGQKHCSKKVKEWLEKCNEMTKKKEYVFVE